MQSRPASSIAVVAVVLSVTACFDPERPAGETAGDESSSTEVDGTSNEDAPTGELGTTQGGTSAGEGMDATGTSTADAGAEQTSDATQTSVTSEPTVGGTETSSTGTSTTTSEEDASGSLETFADETPADAESGGCDCGMYEVCFVYFCREAQVVYLNFDAEGEFVYDPEAREDATENVHGIDPSLVGALPGYGDGSQRAEVLAAVQESFAYYGVVVTDERPTTVDYAMIVFTENPGTDPGAPGAGQVDCNNAIRNSIYFVYLSEQDPFTAAYHANLVTRSIAMGIGLELVVDEDDVMSSTIASDESWFTNECTTIEGAAQCAAQHAQFCDSGAEQLAHMELESVFGWLGAYY